MSVALAVTRSEDPQVFVAADMDVLHWVLALKWVAMANPSSMTEGTRDMLREALLEERWADAVVAYMEHTGIYLDVFPDHDFFTGQSISMGAQELQFRPLFRD